MTKLLNIDNKKQPPIKPKPTPQLTDGQQPVLTEMPEHGAYNPTSFSQIVKYLKKGLTMEETGVVLGVSKQAISQRCQREGFDINNVNAFKDTKTTILEHKQQLMVDSLTPERIKKMSDSVTIVGIGVLDDKIDRARDKQKPINDGWEIVSKSWHTAKDIVTHADPKDLPAIDIDTSNTTIGNQPVDNSEPTNT